MVVSSKTRSRDWWSPVRAKSSCCSETIFCCRVRMSSRPVRSPTWASRGYSWPPKLRCEILPSGVRSNRAPYVSSSQIRAGASLACSSAMRTLLRNLPPRMVSRKWTCQLSFGLTLPIAAAAPPSAMTVCALPKRDLEITAVFLPASRDSMAARRPAPPAPRPPPSYWCRSMSSRSPPASLEPPQVVDPPGRDRHDVRVRDRQCGQGDPRDLHVSGVQLRHEGPPPVAP